MLQHSLSLLDKIKNLLQPGEASYIKNEEMRHTSETLQHKYRLTRWDKGVTKSLNIFKKVDSSNCVSGCALALVIP